MNEKEQIIQDFMKKIDKEITRIIDEKIKSRDMKIPPVLVKEFVIDLFEAVLNSMAGKVKPDENFIQEMIELYRQNPSDIPEEIRDYIKGLAEGNNAIKATTRKAKNLTLETTNIGRKLRDSDILPALYDKNRKVLTGKTGTKKNAKEVRAVITLTFKQLEDWGAYIPQLKELKPFDMEIFNHAITLFEAGNTYISTDMLFRQMNGGKNGQPTDALRREMYDSFSRLGQTWISINTEAEFKAGYNKDYEFRGALLPCSMVIGDVILNGAKAHDCIKIYDKSPLLEYAKAKGQISNPHIEMLNIPEVNRTEENILLIGYLIRAYADMENPHSKRNKNIIRYDTLYDYLHVSGSNQHQLTKNKAKIRATIKKILNAWIEGGFIKSYQELTEDNTPAKQGVKVAKIKLEFYTARELKVNDNSENNS